MTSIAWLEANVLEADNQSGDATHGPFRYLVRTDIQHSHITAKITLATINHADEQNSFAAGAFIQSFVKKGQAQGSPGSFLFGAGANNEGITEIVFNLNVNGCFARAIWEVFYMQG